MKIYLLKVFISLVFGFAILKSPFLADMVSAFCLLLARMTYAITHLFDSAVAINGAIYYWKNYAYAIEVTKECSALGYCLVLITAIVLFPAPWFTRIKVALLSVLFIQAVNVLRLILLLYGRVFLGSESFNIIHYQLLPFLLSTSTALFLAMYIGNRLSVIEQSKKVMDNTFSKKGAPVE